MKVKWHRYPDEIPEIGRDCWVILPSDITRCLFARLERFTTYTDSPYFWDSDCYESPDRDESVMAWAYVDMPEPPKSLDEIN
jgi:hypothetical protein